MEALARNAEEAGRLYVSRKAIPKKLLREAVYHAWERSHLQKANALALKAEGLAERDLNARLHEKAELLKVSEPYMRALSLAAGLDHHAVMLSDNSAILLQVKGDVETTQNPDFPRAGSLLSESTAGANGVGTTLADGGYVEIIGHEHFIRGFHPFTCQGVPIHDAYGKVIGSMSTSVQRPAASRRLKDIFVCAAHGIEAELIYRQLEIAMSEVIKSHESEAALEKLRQDVVQAYTSSKMTLQIASKYFPSKTQYAFELIKRAQRSLDQFKNEAILWRELASSDSEAASSFSILSLLDSLVDIFRTELEVNHAAIFWKWREEAVVFGYRKETARLLLRKLMDEIEKRKGRIEVGVRNLKGQVSLCIGNFCQILPGSKL